MLEYCAYCGKAFQVFGGAWGYAYGGMYTCSYKCMRAMKEEDSVTEEQKRIVDELEGKGLTAREIAAKAGVNPKNVYDYQSRKRKATSSVTPDGATPSPEGKAKTAEAEKMNEAMKEYVAERYRYGWMCPMCRMVWSPWISACNCQRKEEVGVSV